MLMSWYVTEKVREVLDRLSSTNSQTKGVSSTPDKIPLVIKVSPSGISRKEILARSVTASVVIIPLP
jgi:hypothetical protein